MTTYTIADLAAKSLRTVGLYASDEPIASEDQEDAEASATSLIATLAKRGFSIWNGSAADVPEEYYIPLAQYIGMFLLSSYGGQSPTKEQIQGAESVLRDLSAKPISGENVQPDYF